MDGQEIRRPYSLSSSPDIDSDLMITVKKMDKGKVSIHLINELKTGQDIRIMAPSGNFTTDFDPKNNRNFVLFAGGSGITPIMSIMKSALVREPDSRIILVYQNHNEASIIFKRAIDEFQGKYPGRFKVTHILSKPSDSWTGLTGRLSADQVKNIFHQYGITSNNSTVFICGPNGMMETIEDTLDELGFGMKNRFKERFSTPDTNNKNQIGSIPEPNDVLESNVTIILDNEEYFLKIKPDEFILEAALDEDLDMPFSCQSGICTTCRGRLLSGNVIMEDPEGLSDEEITAGYILTCVSHPNSKDLKIEIG
jgi:ring-1,2-phenylacetyl-CoA epoxidase subunit PaaE